MKILIVYSTTEGQTRKIALFMKEVLQGAGSAVTVADAAEDPPAPGKYDAVLIGGSIHIGKYQSPVVHYIKQYATVLNTIHSAFFSVCLAVASYEEGEHRAAEKITNDFLQQTGWKPQMVTQVAGALKYTQYDFFKRLLMKEISRREGRTTDTSLDHEYTNWEAVKAFVLDFAGKQNSA